MSVTAGVSDTITALRENDRGRIRQTKLKRYWPGKAPEWAEEAEEEGDIRTAMTATLGKDFPVKEGWDSGRKDDDPRLHRLAKHKIENLEDVIANHRKIRQSEIVSMIEEENRRREGLELEEENEVALEERRRRIRENLLLRQQEEVLLPEEEEEKEEIEEDEEEESEYETNSNEDTRDITMIKPVFVPKSERDTVVERDRLEKEKRALEELEKRRLEERKVETKQLVIEKIREDKEIKKNVQLDTNITNVDTEDGMNEAEEYETWKVREISRTKRDREYSDVDFKEKEEIKKVRNMTEEERREWERRNPKPAQPSKQKLKFMQKYYHKGAFFQSDADDPAGTAGTDNIYTRDFSAPTGEDKLDRSILPKVMQVKHFGRSGRTKWTHLVNEDTTDRWNNPWNTQRSSSGQVIIFSCHCSC